MRIRIDYPAGEAVFRQSPGGKGVWKDSEFVEGPSATLSDAWVVFERLQDSLTVECDPAKTIFIAGEPPTVRHYDTQFLAQFAAVVAPGHDLVHPGLIPNHSAIPWWVGIVLERQRDKKISSWWLDYDRLKSDGLPAKQSMLSIVCSDKVASVGHRQRLSFVRRLQEHFGARLDVFGEGFKPIPDKWDAIAPYRYHIVIENSRLPQYWTEKLADAFLAGAYPIYCGCPDLSEYFPPDSFLAIDRNDLGQSIAVIEKLLLADPYEQLKKTIDFSRNLVLDEYNLFPVIAKIATQLPQSIRSQRITLHPEYKFTEGLTTRTKRRLKQVATRWWPR